MISASGLTIFLDAFRGRPISPDAMQSSADEIELAQTLSSGTRQSATNECSGGFSFS